MFWLEVDPEIAKPGWVPLIILVVMFVAVFFLYRSMRKQFSRIDADLPYEDELDRDGRRKEPVGSPKSPDVG
ncbi:hypothetical protein ACQBAR_04800 [Propionibacteriaceae bacterium Y1685]|uniref:hypothetical protein n=1 Tax=Microlunatus sp. Y1700 TaxID=3418487 RepID=UPI003B7DC009